jgi:FtsZ-binding cell division protein ZapB
LRLTSEQRRKVALAVERVVYRVYKDAFFQLENRLESAWVTISNLERENEAIRKHALALQKELALAHREREALESELEEVK